MNGLDAVIRERAAGILLHPTSLPDGRIGDWALRFLDFLASAGCRVWQTLPLGPTGPDGSPYSPLSVYAGNPALLPRGGGRMAAQGLEEFAGRESGWLQDYAAYAVLKRAFGGKGWWDWPVPLRDRDEHRIQRALREHDETVRAIIRRQYRFDRAWRRLRAEAGARGILLYGDLPMFTVRDSADVWLNRDLFQLDREGRPLATAGVPPDAFAEEGQHWGNPLFDWEAMKADGFAWWIARVRHELRRFDLLRIDHFRGLVETWAVPASAASAREGAWEPVPGPLLLKALEKSLGRLPLVAENLGVITPEVEALRSEFGLPGMHVFQFAFDGTPGNPHLPERHEEASVAYTGTHDNDTTLGWFRSLSAEGKRRVLSETGGRAGDMPRPAIASVLKSPARLAVIPMQDWLGLGSEHRMNLPGSAAGNWRWRLAPDAINGRLARRIRTALQATGRA